MAFHLISAKEVPWEETLLPIQRHSLKLHRGSEPES